ncbi:hypothetical protein Tco_1227100 [Tanacetum coccineum]
MAVNDSVFQRAMFLYKKQKEEFRSTNLEKISGPITKGPEFVSPSDEEKTENQWRRELLRSQLWRLL